MVELKNMLDKEGVAYTSKDNKAALVLLMKGVEQRNGTDGTGVN